MKIKHCYDGLRGIHYLVIDNSVIIKAQLKLFNQLPKALQKKYSKKDTFILFRTHSPRLDKSILKDIGIPFTHHEISVPGSNDPNIFKTSQKQDFIILEIQESLKNLPKLTFEEISSIPFQQTGIRILNKQSPPNPKQDPK